MKKLFGVILLFICVLSGCKVEDEKPARTSILSPYINAYMSKDSEQIVRVEPFGTSQMSLVGYKKSKVYGVEDKFNELVEKYHSLLDRNYYYKDSEGNFINNIKVINDSYGSGSSVVVDDIIIEVLKEGIKYTKLSNGRFNIFSGSIVDLWDIRFEVFSSSYGIDPSEDEVAEAMNCVVKVNDIDNVLVIDEENNTVVFNSFDGCETGASITLGALAKSYFIDKIVNLEEFKQVGPAIYSAGQSSIILKGENPTRENGAWNIALNDSLNSNSFFVSQAVGLALYGDNALSTSGGEYKGYVNSDGVRRHHIINASNGYPSSFLVGATVIGENAMICDIVTTTLMTMSNLEEIKEYLVLLENNDIKFDVLLQTDFNGTLKIYVNEDMQNNISQVVDGVIVEEFSYGA